MSAHVVPLSPAMATRQDVGVRCQGMISQSPVCLCTYKMLGWVVEPLNS